MTSLEMPRGNEREGGTGEKSIKERMTDILDQEFVLDQLAMQLIRYTRESSQKLRKRIKALSENANPSLLDSVAPLLGDLELTLNRMGTSAALWENEIRKSEELAAKTREQMQRKPENLPSLEQQGILQRREELTNRRFATFPTKRLSFEDFFKTANDCVSNLEGFFGRDMPIPDKDSKKMLEEILKFKPGFENN